MLGFYVTEMWRFYYNIEDYEDFMQVTQNNDNIADLINKNQHKPDSEYTKRLKF